MFVVERDVLNVENERCRVCIYIELTGNVVEWLTCSCRLVGITWCIHSTLQSSNREKFTEKEIQILCL